MSIALSRDKERCPMERILHISGHVTSPHRPVRIDWAFYSFWLGYFSIIFSIILGLVAYFVG
jgi:hypothetical protein